MMLVDQVQVLRENLALLRGIESCVFPQCGSLRDTRTAYEFIRLVLPARDIATMIALADPRGDVLPSHLRGLRVRGRNGVGKSTQMELKKFLGMIVHMTYFRMLDDIDVINDVGERLIVSRATFFEKLERLNIDYCDLSLVVCALVERATASIDYIEGPGYNNLQRLLWDLRIEPELMEVIWEQFFAAEAADLGDINVINNAPHPTVRKSRRWFIAWRRDDMFAHCWVSLSELIETTRECVAALRCKP